MTDSIDDLMPEPEDAQYVSVLECQVCSATGRMYSTGDPRPKQYWDCGECGTDDAEHRIIMKSDSGQQVTR